MKKIAVLLFFSITSFSCTSDDTQTDTEMNLFETNADSTPPTHDPKWGKDKTGVQGN